MGGYQRRTTSAILFLHLLIGLRAAHPPLVLLHLSDIHLSTNTKLYWQFFGDREADLKTFVKKLAPLLAPQATLISGDITDSKNKAGAGLQQEEEWQAYHRVLGALEASGVASSSVLDIRGNHDVFNMPVRGGPLDFFFRYSSQGSRSPSARRVFILRLPVPNRNLEDLSMRGGIGVQLDHSSSNCPRVALLGIDATPEPGLRSPANFGGVVTPGLVAEVRHALHDLLSSTPPNCPALPIIATGHYPLSTMDSPMHVAGPRGILAHITRSVHSMQGMAQLLADFNVSAYVSGHLHAAFGERLHRLHPTPAGGFLAELETAAWKDDRRFRVIAMDGGVLSFADLFFHTPSSPRRPRRTDAATVKSEIWQEAYQHRGYGLTSADPTARVLNHLVLVTYPPDARYSPLMPGAEKQEPEGAQQTSKRRLRTAVVPGASPGAGQGEGAWPGEGCTGAGTSSERLGGHLGWDGIGLACDGSGAGGDCARGRGMVRALVYPVDWESAAAPEGWQVSVLSWLPGGAQFCPPEPMLLQLAHPAARTAEPGAADLAGGGRLFQAALQAELECVEVQGVRGGSEGGMCRPPATHVYLQVEVKGLGGHLSTSSRIPVGLRCRPLAPSINGTSSGTTTTTTTSTSREAGVGGQPGVPGRQMCWVASNDAPLPLDTSWLEWFILAVNGPVLVHRLFICLWACHLAVLLLMPRVLCARWAPRIAASPLFRPRSHPATAAPAHAPAVVVPPASLESSPPERVMAAVGGWLLWPAAALVLMARERAVWTAMVLYCVYLIAGPWYVADLLSGCPKALVFHFGVLIGLQPRMSGGTPSGHTSWRFIGTADTMFITLVHLVFCVLPLTLWVACVVGTRQLSRAPGLCSTSATDLKNAPTSTTRSRAAGSRRGSMAEVPSACVLPLHDNVCRSWGLVGRVLALYSPSQWIGLVLITVTYGYATWDKLAKLNGWLAVLMSPGVGWTIPLAMLLTVWCQLPSTTSSCLGKRD